MLLLLLLALICGCYSHQTEPFLQQLEAQITSQTPHRIQLTTARDYDNELGITFDCDVKHVRHSQRATSVHALGPADVDVVAALGDSITAGNGLAASSLPDVLSQNRGESWSIGGDESLDGGVITFTNAIRKYNPSVKGYSVGKSGQGSANSWLNRAVPGAIASGMPNQARSLIERLQTDERIDYENDWKVATLLIGGNDLCSYCRDRDRFSPENFERHIQEAVDLLHAEVPRMLVNLVPLFDVTNLELLSTGLVCDSMQRSMCSCAFGDTNAELRPVQLAYAQKLRDLATSGRYDTRDDFTVVIQPSMVDVSDPPIDPDTGEVDHTFFSYDCFHPDRKTHQAMALNLWNTMLIPVPAKPQFPPEDTLKLTFTCPTEENPYFATNLNSKWPREAEPVPFRGVDDTDPDKPEVSLVTVLGAVLGSCALIAVAMAILFVKRKKIGEKVEVKGVEMESVGVVNPACAHA